jgi:hypothetical protein
MRLRAVPRIRALVSPVRRIMSFSELYLQRIPPWLLAAKETIARSYIPDRS